MRWLTLLSVFLFTACAVETYMILMASPRGLPFALFFALLLLPLGWFVYYTHKREYMKFKNVRTEGQEKHKIR